MNIDLVGQYYLSKNTLKTPGDGLEIGRVCFYKLNSNLCSVIEAPH